MKGLISLDIDGTLTADHHYISKDVINYLQSLAEVDWQIVLITGRPYNMLKSIIERIPFPCSLAVQNGAIILELPSHEILSKKYLSLPVLFQVESLCKTLNTEFVVYSGYENHDECYYIRDNFDAELLSYLDARIHEFNENWVNIKNWDNLPVQEFASFKCFAKKKHVYALAKYIESHSLHAPAIRDPFDQNYYVIQITQNNVNKGSALKNYMKIKGLKAPVIAAGDDFNDIPMLRESNIKIVMETAPKEMIEMADIVAPSAKKGGIIYGLKEALKKI